MLMSMFRAWKEILVVGWVVSRSCLGDGCYFWGEALTACGKRGWESGVLMEDGR